MNKEIKVIKKIDRQRKPEPKKVAEKTALRQGTRETVKTIAGWVRDVQDKSRNDARRAFNNLFHDPLIGVTET